MTVRNEDGRLNFKVIPFRSRAELDAEINLRAFIKHAKEALDLYGGPDFDWDAPAWDVGAWHTNRGANKTKKASTTIAWSALGSTRWKQTPMASEFIDFAKASVRQMQTLNFEKNKDPHLAALRALERALIDCHGKADVTKTDGGILDVAAKLIEGHHRGESPYQQGWRLQKLAEFLNEYHLVRTRFEWKHPFAPPEPGNLLGKAAERKRAEKLPSREALEALGNVWYKASTERDIVLTSSMALLFADPERVCEAVTAHVNCIHEYPPNDDGKIDLGLRWYPAKGGEEGIKPLNDLVAPIIIQSLERLRPIGDEGREMARWYERNGTDKIFLPEDLWSLREKKWVNGKELCSLLGFTRSTDASKIARGHGFTARKVQGEVPSRMKKDGTQSTMKKVVQEYLFEDVEKYVLTLLPEGFPWLDKENGVRYSEGLCVVRRGIMSPARGTSRCMFEAVSKYTLTKAFSVKSKSENIFYRNGLTMPDGSMITLKSHQLRIWLNTMAERGGMSHLDRDVLSGRKTGDAKHGHAPTRASRAYLHNSPEEIAEAAGIKMEDLDQSPIATAVGKLPVSMDEIMAEADKPTYLITEMGICAHDFALSPCSTHLDCVNCMEHAFIKGEKEQADRVRSCHKLAMEQIEMAKEMVDEGYLKAEKWYQHQTLTAKRTAGVLELLDDPDLPDGTLIALANPFQYSAFRNAVDNRAERIGDPTSLMLAAKMKVPKLPVLEVAEK